MLIDRLRRSPLVRTALPFAAMVALGGTLGVKLFQRFGPVADADDCCKPGAPCCYPGSPCCARHHGVTASR